MPPGNLFSLAEQLAAVQQSLVLIPGFFPEAEQIRNKIGFHINTSQNGSCIRALCPLGGTGGFDESLIQWLGGFPSKQGYYSMAGGGGKV